MMISILGMVHQFQKLVIYYLSLIILLLLVSIVFHHYMLKTLVKLKNNTKKKIIIYPNSGEIYNPEEKIWTGNKLYEDKMIKKWLSLSPDIIGGCCRVGYDDIKKMRQEIDNYEK